MQLAHALGEQLDVPKNDVSRPVEHAVPLLIASAIALNASREGCIPSSFAQFSPLSSALHRSTSIGIAPKNGTCISEHIFLPPSLPKM